MVMMFKSYGPHLEFWLMTQMLTPTSPTGVGAVVGRNHRVQVVVEEFVRFVLLQSHWMSGYGTL